MSKIDQQQPSEVTNEEDRCFNFKLDPSLLLRTSREESSSVKKISSNQEIMVLRKRGITKEKRSPRFHSRGAISSKSTFLPKEQEACETTQSSSERTSSGQNKIFSVTTSVVLSVTLATLIGAICLANSNRALLVSAQFSSLTSNPQPLQQQQQQQQPQPQQPQVVLVQPQQKQPQQQPPAPVGRPQMGQRHQHQQTLISAAQTQSISTPSTTTVSGQMMPEEAQATKSRLVSIDRFDSGEQIRPPLLRQPTTLAPLTKPQQVSAVNIGQINLQTAASQESYMSPEDRDQLLRSQESHYEGKSMEPNSQSDPSSSGSDGGYERPIRWNQHQQDAKEPPARLKGSESRSGRVREAANAVASNEADDGDYEDDAVESPEKKRANAVPENRRMADDSSSGGGGYEASARQRGESGNNYNKNRPQVAASAASVDPNDDSESNDDYGGANDDAYFGRKSSLENGGLGNQLNSAASHNQQNRNNNPKQSGDGRGAAYGESGSSDSDAREPDDSPGFGPGPNEAYMVDKAESGHGKAGLDSEDDGPYSGSLGDSDSAIPSSDDITGNGGEKLDRRSMGDAAQGAVGKTADSPYSGYDQSKSMNPFDAGSEADLEDEADDGGDSVDETSGPSYAQSSKEEVKSPSRPILGLESRLQNVLPRTSASGIAPLATISHQSEQVRPIPATLPISSSPATSAIKTASMGAHNNQPLVNQASASPSYQQIHATNQLNHLLHHSHQTQPPIDQMSNILSSMNLHKPTMSAPYNPQNNPSHAGKYFIN